MSKKQLFARILLVLVVFGLNASVDQITKHWAREEVRGRPASEYIGGIVVITYAENTGAFLGLGSKLEGPLHTLMLLFLPSLITLAGLIWLCAKIGAMSIAELVIVSCFLAGGASNLYDRIAFGKVTDFLLFRFGPVSTGVLNVADMSITFGAIAFVIVMFVRERKSLAAKKIEAAKSDNQV